MTTLVRHVALLAVAAAFSWWLLLYQPAQWGAANRRPSVPATMTITPRVERARQASPPTATVPRPPAGTPAAKAPPTTQPVAGEPSGDSEAPPPAELGVPEGITAPNAPASDRTPEPTSSPSDASTSEPSPDEQETRTDKASAIAKLMTDHELLKKARGELTGKVRKGFATVLLAAPEDQLSIARFFGEELVLVPRSALDPNRVSPVWFRLGAGSHSEIEEVRGRPQLDNYRQYRDLFDYEYGRLPKPLRALRKSVLLRTEVYIFAALIPVPEWAAVIGRRAEALAESGRELAEVRRFVMRYVGSPGGSYDVLVHEIVFADGSIFHPDSLSGSER